MASFPGKVADGVGIYEPKDWNALRNFLDDRVDFDSVIWRGQRRESWALESTLDRLIRRSKIINPNFGTKHLEEFKYACRGRRGPAPTQLSEDEWWSLGQHFGLDTPLLDWSASPFVGLFFAFAKITDATAGERRVLFGLKGDFISKDITAMRKRGQPVIDSLHIIRPKIDENPRLISQNGMFTKVPTGTDLETMIRRIYAGKKALVLYKILIPEAERLKILKALNRMNINYLSLFPDLSGASLFCNLRSEIPKY